MGSTSSHGDKHNRQIMAVENPWWPHTCKVYRMRGVSNFSKGEQEIIYEGPCRKYGNTSIRTFTGNDGVQRADYALSIPGQIRGISTGVLIDVEDLVGTISGAIATDSYPTNLGTTVYFCLPKN